MRLSKWKDHNMHPASELCEVNMPRAFLVVLSLLCFSACTQARNDADYLAQPDGIYPMVRVLGDIRSADTVTIKDGRIFSVLFARQGFHPASIGGYAGNTGMFYGATDEQPALGKLEWSWIGGMGDRLPWHFGLTARWTNPQGTMLEYYYDDSALSGPKNPSDE